MRYWDSSAVIPLIVSEAMTRWALVEFEEDPDVVAWWGTPVECASALGRLEREGRLVPPAISEALRRLSAIRDAWTEIQPTDRVRSTALRLLRTHAVRAGDALQLAAAIIAAEDHPSTLPFVTLDDRLAAAADREGFAVVGSRG